MMGFPVGLSQSLSEESEAIRKSQSLSEESEAIRKSQSLSEESEAIVVRSKKVRKESVEAIVVRSKKSRVNLSEESSKNSSRVNLSEESSKNSSRVTLSEESEERVTLSEEWSKNSSSRVYIPDNIPDNVSLSILSKLPLKSLKRFECACKTWSVLLQNSYFMNMFNNNNSLMSVSKDYENTYLVLPYFKDRYRTPSEFYLLPDNVLQNRVKIDWPLPFQVHGSMDHIFILGSVSIHGLFCLKRANRVTTPVLWNPTTGEYKVIPPSATYSLHESSRLAAHYGLHGFGYDSVTNDYKVLQLIHYPPLNNQFKIPRDISPKYKSRLEKQYDSSWELYSLTNKSWKQLDNIVPHRYDYTLPIGVYVNGVSHWWARSKLEYDPEECLISFDYTNEIFFTTPAPSYLDLNLRTSVILPNRLVQGEKHLVPLNDSIALISTYVMISTFHVSILGELGVKESWTKLFVINHLPFINCPIGVGIRNNVFFFKQKGGDLACIDLNTKIIQQDLGVNPWHCGSQIGKYKKTSLPI